MIIMSTIWLNSISQYITIIWVCFKYNLKNAGLNTTQHWVKYGRTQQLDYCPEGWVWKQPSMCSVQYLPSTGLYLVSALDITPTDRWLNAWCIWYTYLETLQKCRSRHRIGWIIQDFRETFFNVPPGNKERRKLSCLQLWRRMLIRIN